jgi:protein SCO1/2
MTPIGKTPNSRLTLFATLAVTVVGAAVLLYIILGNRPAPAANPPAIVEGGQTFDGITVVNPPRALQDFTLVDQHNKPVSLSSLRGKATLLLFGYTHCPDVCPITLFNFKQIKKALGDQADKMQFVFISVDGERDTPDKIAEYVNKFDEAFIGLSGDEATLRRIAPDYNLYFGKAAGKDSTQDSYLVDHTSNTFLIDAGGRLIALYTFGLKAEQIAPDVLVRLGG